jgi:SAM-dependent methyltransferase
MSLATVLTRLVYPDRQVFRIAGPEDDEIEGWVEAAALPYFSSLDEDFVNRALGLGVTSGMVLDLNSPLGLIPMKILWKQEDLLAVGVYRTREMADRTSETAMEWGLAERMFFQVGEPRRFRFKDGYFDLVVSDCALNQWEDPAEVLAEIGRITKPSGAILIRDLLRPNRLQISRHIRKYGANYPERLREPHARAVRAGFTPEEFLTLSGALGVDRVRVLRDATHVLIERRGTDDPTSWVVERERYL